MMTEPIVDEAVPQPEGEPTTTPGSWSPAGVDGLLLRERPPPSPETASLSGRTCRRSAPSPRYLRCERSDGLRPQSDRRRRSPDEMRRFARSLPLGECVLDDPGRWRDRLLHARGHMTDGIALRHGTDGRRRGRGRALQYLRDRRLSAYDGRAGAGRVLRGAARRDVRVQGARRRRSHRRVRFGATAAPVPGVPSGRPPLLLCRAGQHGASSARASSTLWPRTRGPTDARRPSRTSRRETASLAYHAARGFTAAGRLRSVGVRFGEPFDLSGSSETCEEDRRPDPVRMPPPRPDRRAPAPARGRSSRSPDGALVRVRQAR